MLHRYNHLIHTNRGIKHITEINPGDYVYACNTNQFNLEYKPTKVLEVVENKPCKMIKILFTDKREICLGEDELLFAGIRRDTVNGSIKDIKLDIQCVHNSFIGDEDYYKNFLRNVDYSSFRMPEKRFGLPYFENVKIDPYLAGVLSVKGDPNYQTVTLGMDLPISDHMSLKVLMEDKNLREKYWEEIFPLDIKRIFERIEYCDKETIGKFLSGIFDVSLDIKTSIDSNRLVLKIDGDNKVSYLRAEGIANILRSLGEKVIAYGVDVNGDKNLYIFIYPPFVSIYSYQRIYEIIKEYTLFDREYDTSNKSETLQIYPSCKYKSDDEEYYTWNLVLEDNEMLYLTRNYLPRVSL